MRSAIANILVPEHTHTHRTLVYDVSLSRHACVALALSNFAILRVKRQYSRRMELSAFTFIGETSTQLLSLEKVVTINTLHGSDGGGGSGGDVDNGSGTECNSLLIFQEVKILCMPIGFILCFHVFYMSFDFEYVSKINANDNKKDNIKTSVQRAFFFYEAKKC